MSPTITKRCIAIGVGTYEDPNLANLRCPTNDIKRLDSVLSNESRGGFDQVVTLPDCNHNQAHQTIHEMITASGRNDLLVIYFSGHGKRSKAGDLYLATTDTKPDRIETSAIELEKIYKLVKSGNCRSVILILDCCYSGAAGGVISKGGIEDNLQVASSGSGLYIVTASTGVQTSVEKEEDDLSLFTKHLIAGLETGDADRNGDGKISVDEMYDYLHQALKNDSTHQEPMRWGVNIRGELYLSQSGRMPRVERKKEAQEILFNHLKDDRLTNDVFTAALKILEKPTTKLTELELRNDKLVTLLLDGDINAAQFLRKWKLTDSINPAPDYKTPDQDDQGFEKPKSELNKEDKVVSEQVDDKEAKQVYSKAEDQSTNIETKTNAGSMFPFLLLLIPILTSFYFQYFSFNLMVLIVPWAIYGTLHWKIKFTRALFLLSPLFIFGMSFTDSMHFGENPYFVPTLLVSIVLSKTLMYNSFTIYNANKTLLISLVIITIAVPYIYFIKYDGPYFSDFDISLNFEMVIPLLSLLLLVIHPPFQSEKTIVYYLFLLMVIGVFVAVLQELPGSYFTISTRYIEFLTSSLAPLDVLILMITSVVSFQLLKVESGVKEATKAARKGLIRFTDMVIVAFILVVVAALINFKMELIRYILLRDCLLFVVLLYGIKIPMAKSMSTVKTFGKFTLILLMFMIIVYIPAVIFLYLVYSPSDYGFFARATEFRDFNQVYLLPFEIFALYFFGSKLSKRFSKMIMTKPNETKV